MSVSLGPPTGGDLLLKQSAVDMRNRGAQLGVLIALFVIFALSIVEALLAIDSQPSAPGKDAES